MSQISKPWPNYSEEEVDAVSAVLRSGKVNYWTGTECREFEKEFAEFAGTKYAIALANGTVALDLALAGLGLGAHNGGSETDEVIVTPRSFMASVSSIVNAGARPVFADVDLRSQNITPETTSRVLTDNTKAILCVHLAGWPCDMDGFKDLIEGRDIFLIEDCAQAHGALYKGRPVGSLGDVAAWSFCQDKIMTTAGEGGMVTTGNKALWSRMWSYKDHGKNWDSVYNKEHPPGFRFLHDSFGTNWRLTEMQAVVGRIQLRRMPAWQRERAANAQAVMNLVEGLPNAASWLEFPRLSCPHGTGGSNADSRHAFYKLYAFVKPENLPDGRTRDDIIACLNAQGMIAMQGSCSEIYREKAFDGTDFRPNEDLENAKRLGETSIMFLVHPGCEYPALDRLLD